YEGMLDGSAQIIVSDGYGKFSIANETVKATLNENTLTLVWNNSMKVIEIDFTAKTYEQKLDGYQGIYTLPGEDADTIKLNGYGEVVDASDEPDGRTYVVDGATITIYEGETKTAYGIDKEKKEFLDKSAFAGLTFTGTYKEWGTDTEKVYVVFDDSATITGTIYPYTNGNSEKFTFTAELSPDKKTITFTFNSAPSAVSGAGGKTLIGNISGNKITFAKGTYSNSNTYTFYDSGSVTCEGFSL
ncbi:MAG: hypothetical protein K2J30_03940, partial [Clostridia bacterium]|nr:hypothetical protein [Clostridia bacterium]